MNLWAFMYRCWDGCIPILEQGLQFFFKTVCSILRNPKLKIDRLIELKHCQRDLQGIGELEFKDKNYWHINFRGLLLSSNEDRFFEMIKEFYENSLELVNIHMLTEDLPIVVCVLKDDIYRLPEFYKHYRKIGVSSFIIVDNGSTDGTLEYLMDQDDTQVFRTDSRYNSKKKTAWGNKAIAYNGMGKWYLIPDSDELFVYSEMDNYHLPDYIRRIEEKGIKSVKSSMLEMYPNDAFFRSNGKPETFKAYYRFLMAI